MARKSTVTVHIHDWLYEMMYNISAKSGLTQAEAMDELFTQKNEGFLKLENENKQLKQHLEASEKAKKELEQKYKEVNTALEAMNKKYGKSKSNNSNTTRAHG